MFDFLKDMLGFPRPVKVTGYENEEVVFVPEQPLDLGLVGVLAEIEGVKVRGQIQVLEVGLEECRGLWIQPAEVLPLLKECYTHQEKRGETRYLRRLRVRSPKLEDFAGHTLDLSHGGMRIEGRGEFKPGEVISITFDLDDERQTEVAANAKVCWIGPTASDGWHAMGLEYQNFSRQQQTELYSYYREFLANIGNQKWERIID